MVDVEMGGGGDILDPPSLPPSLPPFPSLSLADLDGTNFEAMPPPPRKSKFSPYIICTQSWISLYRLDNLVGGG